MKGLYFVALALMLAGCGRNSPLPKAAANAAPTRAVTDWTTNTELFLEYPSLVKTQTSRFAVHLTSLNDFKPVDSGRVEVRLARPDGTAEAFVTDAPSKAGIFGVDVRPTAAGLQKLTVKLVSTSFTDTHELGTVNVYADAAAAARQPAEAKKEETIAFLKEQQWSLDFATELVRERSERSSLRVAGEVRPRTGGEAEVTVPFTGRLVASNLPALGTSVGRGQVLAEILPPTSTPADLPTLEMARAEAQTALELARLDLQRAQTLLDAGAVPARRVEEARATQVTQEERLKAAEARLGQYQSTRYAESDGQEDRLFKLSPSLA